MSPFRRLTGWIRDLSTDASMRQTPVIAQTDTRSPSNPESDLTQQPFIIHGPGDIIAGRYSVVKVLEGGMAQVYLCLEMNEMRPVALKTFKPEFLGDPETRERSLHECGLWINLGEHPNIVRAHAVEISGVASTPYLVLDWISQPDGKKDASMRSWLIPNHPVVLKQALMWCWEIARGMQYAVTRVPGLVHRDLKPENVLIGFDGRAQVTDFGLAVAAQWGGQQVKSDDRWSPTRTQVTEWGVCGTPIYMAPEQWIAGQPLDQRTDIYALGCILYELLTGRPAAWGDSLRAIRNAHLLARRAPLTPNVPVHVHNFVQSTLSLNPDQRHSDWNKVLTALEYIIRDVTGEPPSTAGYPQIGERAAHSLGSSWLALANAYHQVGKPKDALAYANKAIAVAQESGWQVLHGEATNTKGLILLHLGRPGAIALFMEAVHLFSERTHPALLGSALMNLASAYRLQGDLSNAKICCDQAKSIGERIDDLYLQAAALNTLGNIYRMDDDFGTALSFYQQSLIFFEQIGDLREIGKVMNNLGITHRQLRKPFEALKCYERSLTVSKEIGDFVGANRVQMNIGNINRDTGDYDKALTAHQSALAGAKELGEQRSICLGLANIGYDLLAMSDFDGAIPYLQQARDMAQAANNPTDQAFAVEGLRMAQAHQPWRVPPVPPPARTSKASESEMESPTRVPHHTLGRQRAMGRPFQDKALAQPIKGKKTIDEATVRNAVALQMYDQGQYGPAAELLELLVKKEPDSTLYGLLGHCYRDTGQNDKAITAYHNSLALSPNEAVIHQSLGVLLFRLGRLAEAIASLEAAARLQPKLPNHRGNLAAAYRQAGHVEEALREYETWSKLAPDEVEAHDLAAHLHLQLEHWSDAERHLGRLVQLQPSNTNYHLTHGAVLFRMSRFADAAQEGRYAVRLGESQAWKLVEMAEAKMKDSA